MRKIIKSKHYGSKSDVVLDLQKVDIAGVKIKTASNYIGLKIFLDDGNTVFWDYRDKNKMKQAYSDLKHYIETGDLVVSRI